MDRPATQSGRSAVRCRHDRADSGLGGTITRIADIRNDDGGTTKTSVWFQALGVASRWNLPAGTFRRRRRSGAVILTTSPCYWFRNVTVREGIPKMSYAYIPKFPFIHTGPNHVVGVDRSVCVTSSGPAQCTRFPQRASFSVHNVCRTDFFCA